MFKKKVKILRIEFNNYIDEVFLFLLNELKKKGWKEITENTFKYGFSYLRVRIEKLEKIYFDVWEQDYFGYIIPYKNPLFFSLRKLIIDGYVNNWINKLKEKHNDIDYNLTEIEVETFKIIPVLVILAMIIIIINYVTTFILKF